MAAEEVKAKVLKNAEKGIPQDLEATVTYDFGDNLADAISKFTEGIVFETYVDAARVKLQAYIRILLQRGSTPSEIVELVSKWKLGEKGERPVDVVAELKGNMSSMSEVERVEYIKRLAAAAGVPITELGM